jgi:hypothetical protein
MKPTDELSAMLQSADHEPLLRDDEILGLLATAPVASHKSILRKPWAYAAAATVAACAIGVYTVMQPDVSEPALDDSLHEEILDLNQSSRVSLESSDRMSGLTYTTNKNSILSPRARKDAVGVAYDAPSGELLARLGIDATAQAIRFAEGYSIITVTNRGIGVRPNRSLAKTEAPVAVTLYDAKGAYASWYDATEDAPNVGALRAIRFALPDDPAMGRTDVAAVLWYAPQADATDASDNSGKATIAAPFRIERIAPNPVADDEATITITSTEQRAVRIRLLDIVGRELMTVYERFALNPGDTGIPLTGLSRLPGGMIILIIEDQVSGGMVTSRILIQR